MRNLPCPEKSELPWNFSLYWIYFLHSGFLTTCACPENSFPWNFSLYWIYLYHSRFLTNFALALKNRDALKFFTVWNILFTIQDSWATCACPEKQSCPETFHCIEYVFFMIQEFWATCACPEQQSCPGNFAVLKYILSFRIFEQLALALKNRVALEFFTVLNNVYFYHSGVLINLRLPWKTEGALNSLYWICIFYYSWFFSNLRLPWKTQLPWSFSLYWICIFYHSGFLSNVRLPWKQSCPGIFHCIE